MMARISQREAHRLKKRVEALEAHEEKRRRAWSQEWFGGVQIAAVRYDDPLHAVLVAVKTARVLGHAVVVVGDNSSTSTLRLMALPWPKEVA